MADRKPAVPIRRKGIWVLQRRIPNRYRTVDKRLQVVLSTGIRVADDPEGRRAQGRVKELDERLHKQWELQLAGGSLDTVVRFERAQSAARRFGIELVEPEKLLQLHLDDFVSRLRPLLRPENQSNAAVIDAIFGKVTAPKFTLSDLLPEFERVNRFELSKKGDDQLKRWRMSRIHVVECFKQVLGGDRDIASISSFDVQRLRDWYQDRMIAGAIEPETANKRLGELRAMIGSLVKHHKLEVRDYFQGLSFEVGEKKVRKAYSVAHVRDVILGSGFLDGLNEEARFVIYMMAELGLRTSEAVCLDETVIVLNHAIPHLKIVERTEEGKKHRLKTVESARVIPLIGWALEAARKNPRGAPRYWGKATSLSNLVNKYLRNNGGTQPGCTLYSLRHTFYNRMKEASFPYDMRERLMGHSLPGPKYGDEFGLEILRDHLERIAFKTRASD